MADELNDGPSSVYLGCRRCRLGPPPRLTHSAANDDDDEDHLIHRVK